MQEYIIHLSTNQVPVVEPTSETGNVRIEATPASGGDSVNVILHPGSMVFLSHPRLCVQGWLV